MPETTVPETTAAQRLDALYEFDREPVSQERLLGPGYFIGAFAGEHVAATEFVIGSLFVTWGANVRDIFLGLAIGNLFAVLAWALICAPIAVETRLTFYWYLRRIGGPGMALIYNFINAVLFSVLAGCMITVSASAVRIPFGIPAQVNWYPEDWRFMLVVLLVGSVVVTLATLGFKSVAAFSSVCAPWMFLMFLAGAMTMIPVIAKTAGIENVLSAAGWLELCRAVWTGATPDGSAPVGFGKVAAFAAIANLSMHAGLSDMALFRYAKKASYGFASVFGMFLGHYIAWICAGLMGAGAALAAATPLTQMDAGGVAYQALGVSGILAVVVAGWTTSNPTLYRAGLALQAVTPNWSRTRVTIITGVITTVIACFPFVFTKLLDFVGLYGLLLSPAGVIVLTEHYLFPRLGMPRYWLRGTWNWPAIVAWGSAVAGSMWLEQAGVLHLFYLYPPTALWTCILYITLVKLSKPQVPKPQEPERAAAPAAESPVPPAAEKPIRAQQRWAGILALVCLAACVYLPSRVLHGFALLEDITQPLFGATLGYLAAGTLWYRSRA
jgi:NCS1 family nucleobase:cation symporter-1